MRKEEIRIKAMSMFLCVNASDFTNVLLKSISHFELYECIAFQILTLFMAELSSGHCFKCYRM